MSSGSTPTTFMPWAHARIAICNPMPPIPITSARLPFSSTSVYGLDIQFSSACRAMKVGKNRVSVRSIAIAWSAISGPWTIWLLVRTMSLFARASEPDLCSTCSTPALSVCTQRSCFPARTSSGVMLPMYASASAISFIALSEVTRTSLTLLEADCQSAMVSALWPATRILSVCAPQRATERMLRAIQRVMGYTSCRRNCTGMATPRPAA